MPEGANGQRHPRTEQMKDFMDETMNAAARRGSGSRRRQRPHVPGEEGLWVFIFGDLLMFSLFFCTYLFYRAGDLQTFMAAQATLDRGAGLVNTFLLLTSSLLVVCAVGAYRRGLTERARSLMLSATLCGIGFAVVKVFEYKAKLAQGLTPVTNDFFMFYYMLTGIHLLHLTVGLVLLIVVTVSMGRPRGPALSLVEGTATYWHLVDLLWIMLFPLLYLVR
jgi:nitric oxide reductase NorE protein